jgi:deoxyadenosine/deoxycytidine kinase
MHSLEFGDLSQLPPADRPAPISRGIHIAIAGNIGSGKTTLAGLLGRHLGFEVEYEDPNDNPYIYDFYSDMKRWSFNLQVHFLNNRVQQTRRLQRSGHNYLQDRTLYEDAEIFTANLLSMGLMTQRDYDTYRALYTNMVQLVRPPDLLIYLSGSISKLVEQISSRGREYEDNIRIDYLRSLNERYNRWYQRYDLSPKIEFVTDELDFKSNPEHLGIIVQRIHAAIFGLFPDARSTDKPAE